MVRIRFFASLLSLLCIIQMCLAGRIQRDASSTEESTEIAWTADEIEKYNAVAYHDLGLKEALRGGVSFETFMNLYKTIQTVRELPPIQSYTAYCDVLDPDLFDNKLPPPADDDEYFQQLMISLGRSLPEEWNPHYKNLICPYIRNPKFDEDYAKSVGITRHQYHKMQDIRRRNNDTSNAGLVSVGRKLCKVLQESEIIAKISKLPEELSPADQVTAVRFLETANTEAKFRDACSFIGEIVSSVHQAEALNIPVALYDKIVVIRKGSVNELEIWKQVEAWLNICIAIDESDGVLNKTYPEEAFISLGGEREFVTMIRKVDYVKNSKKIGRWRKACEFLSKNEVDAEEQ